jgi:hypothetical protein
MMVWGWGWGWGSIGQIISRDQSNFWIDFGHNGNELLEVDASVSVLVGVLDHLVHLSG